MSWTNIRTIAVCVSVIISKVTVSISDSITWWSPCWIAAKKEIIILANWNFCVLVGERLSSGFQDAQRYQQEENNKRTRVYWKTPVPPPFHMKRKYSVTTSVYCWCMIFEVLTVLNTCHLLAHAFSLKGWGGMLHYEVQISTCRWL